MNQQTRLVLGTDILGDSCLQERFTAYVALLGHIVQRGSGSTCLQRMTEMSDMPPAALKRHFQELGSAGILKKSRGKPDTWALAKDPWDITLEDVYRCAVAACSARRRGTKSQPAPADNLDIEMVLMQALRAVDDHLYKKLRTYSLDRLRASSATPFPLPRSRAMRMFTDIDQLTS